jgi:transposase
MFSHYTGGDRKGRPVLVRRLRCDQLLRVLGELEPCLIGIEASTGATGAFYWQGQFEKLGHAVKIMAPQYVKPFVRRQKNDTNDAEAICTAVQQPNMRFVPKKTLQQQDIQALHRARQRLVNHRPR